MLLLLLLFSRWLGNVAFLKSLTEPANKMVTFIFFVTLLISRPCSCKRKRILKALEKLLMSVELENFRPQSKFYFLQFYFLLFFLY